MIGIRNTGGGIGDQIQFSSLPENYFKNTGEKLVDLDHCWIFDYNPYVLRDVPVEREIDLWMAHDHPAYKRFGQSGLGCSILGLKKIYLRHSRLYAFEEPYRRISGLVVIHTTGKTVGGEIPNSVIRQVQIAYPTSVIVQVGGRGDRPTPFKDQRGLGMWETAEWISRAEIFIGVNSGMMNIANCYPRVHRKLIILDPKEAEEFIPMNTSGWIDFNWSYFNTTEDDLGATYSFLKI